MAKVDITDAQVTIIVEVGGQVCLTRMDRDEYDAVSYLIKQTASGLIKTGKTQQELNEFLLPEFFKEETNND